MGCSYKFVALVKFAAQIAVKFAQMAELVDAHGSGPCAFGCGGSSPLLGTNNLRNNDCNRMMALLAHAVLLQFITDDILTYACANRSIQSHWRICQTQ